jgi:hypothetical protein
VQQVSTGGGKGLSGDRLGELRRVAGVQRAEGDLGEQSGGPHADCPVPELGILATVVVAQRPGHQERAAVGELKAEGDEGQRLLVAPLHVVQHQQRRAAHGQQRPREALVEAVALPGVHHRPRSGPAPSVALAGHQPADLGAPGGVEGRRRRLDRGVAQPVRHRGQRKPPRRPEALGARDHGALQLCHRGDLCHQAGLADTRTAADEREAAAASGRGPPHVLELAELG